MQYEGEAAIDGVPGTHDPIMIEFVGVAGSSCGALFPTGNVVDEIGGIPVTLVDNGMPVVMIAADAVGLDGNEAIEELEANQELKDRIEVIRLQAGQLMNLGDVSDKTVPKMTIVSAANKGGMINTRSFIPHRVHEAVGVLAAASVAVAAATKGAVGNDVAVIPGEERKLCYVEHPTGALAVDLEFSDDPNDPEPKSTAIMRTARLLMSGMAFYIPSE